MHQRRPRKRPLRELCERPLAPFGFGRPPEHELEEKVDELLVRSLVGSELRLQPLVHSGERYCVAYS